jgi:hypothetical protein
VREPDLTRPLTPLNLNKETHMAKAKAAAPKKTKAPATPAVVNPLNEVIPGSNKANYNDKVVVIKRSFFSPEYADKDRRFTVSGGFGCHAEARGTAVFGKFVLDGERTQVERYDIEGLAAVIPPPAA